MHKKLQRQTLKKFRTTQKKLWFQTEKFQIGDRVLIRVIVKSRKSKLSDKWERNPYIYIDMPNQDIPENKVQKESGKANIRTLHRKFLLLFISISDN